MSDDSHRIGDRPQNRLIARVFGRKMERQMSFLDHLQRGMNLNCVIGIDFTGSNGNPTYPKSLHYINQDPTVLNNYERSIISVGTVLEVNNLQL